MSGLELRRLIAVAAALTWPVVRLAESIFHPHWGTALSDAVAPLVAMVILALVVTSPAAHRKHPEAQPRHARTPVPAMEVVLATMSRLSARVGDLSLRMDHCEERQVAAEAGQERTNARLVGAIGVINEANQMAGLPAPDMDETMPGGRRLRAVRPLGGRRQAG